MPNSLSTTTTSPASASPPPRTSSAMASTSKPPFLLIPANNAHYTQQPQAHKLSLPPTLLPVPNPPPQHVHFKAPAHSHSHHIHSIPPRHKSARSLILDQMLHEQFNTRMASVRAELGLSIPSGLAAAEREDVWKQRHFALPFAFDEKELVIDFANQSLLAPASQSGYNPPRVPNQTLALQLYSKAQGISNVVRATVSQPPHPLSSVPHQHHHHGHHHHDERVPNGVRFRLFLAILADVYFCPRSSQSNSEPASSEVPAYLAPLVALSSFRLTLPPQGPAPPASNNHPTLPGIKSILTNSPPSTSSSPASPFASFTAAGVSPRTTTTPTFFGQQQAPAARKNSSGSNAAFGSNFALFGKAPARTSSGDSVSSSKNDVMTIGGNMSSAPLPKSMQPWASSYDKTSSAVSTSSASHLFSKPIARTQSPTHCTRHLRPVATCNSPTCPRNVTSSSSWAYKKQTIIGAGLDTKSLASLGGAVPGEPHLITAIKLFIRFSALVCAEVMADSERAAEEAKREGSPMDTDDDSSSGSDSDDEAAEGSASGNGEKSKRKSEEQRQASVPLQGAGGEKYIPQREWYGLLCGLVTRAVLEGYLLHGWKETKALEVLFGIGSAPPRQGSFSGSDTLPGEQGEYDPDGYLGLKDSYWNLFPSTPGAPPSEALKEFRAEMIRRRDEFITLPKSTSTTEPPTTLEAHLMQLNDKYPPESVERLMVRFSEGCGRWKGAGELDPPANANNLSSGASTTSTISSTPTRSGGTVKIWFAPVRRLSINTRSANASSVPTNKNGALASTGTKRARSGSLSPLSPGGLRKKEKV